MAVKWDLSAQGVEEIRRLEKSLANCVESLNQYTTTLASAWDDHRDRLGQFAASMDNALTLMNGNNEVCAETTEAICARMELYVQRIEEFLVSFSQEELAPAQGNPSIGLNKISPGETVPIRQRTIFEITSLKNSLDLTGGDPDIAQIGGTYSNVKKSVDSTLYEVHHIPPQSVFADNFKFLPTIAMLKEDHAKTSSYRGKMGKTYHSIFPGEVEYPAHKQSLMDLLNNGLLAEAIRNEIYEIRDTFGSKYDGAIQQYLDSMVGYVSKEGIPKVKK